MNNRRKKSLFKTLGTLLSFTAFAGVGIFLTLMNRFGTDYDLREILIVSYLIAFTAVFGGFIFLVNRLNR